MAALSAISFRPIDRLRQVRAADIGIGQAIASSDLSPPYRHWLPFLLTMMLGACTPAPEHTVIELRGSTMGTTYSIKVVDPPHSTTSDDLKRDIDEILERVNNSMSTYRADSELSRFNNNASTDWIPVSRELLSVLQEAKRTSEQTGGAFDVTVGPLVNLWGFGPQDTARQVPTEAEISAARARVGFRKLAIRSEPPAINKSIPDLYVDLSAIAKGYGVDQVVQHLASRGIENYLVEIGGELHAAGHSGRGTPWRVAVERPDARNRSVHQILELRAGGMATSGDYRNFYEKDGKRYAHTIDPATGRPVTHELASVTVLMPDALRADALATALMVLGPEAGFQMAESQGIAAFFVVRKGKDYSDRATESFKTYLQQKPDDD